MVALTFLATAATSTLPPSPRLTGFRAALTALILI